MLVDTGVCCELSERVGIIMELYLAAGRRVSIAGQLSTAIDRISI